MNRRTKNDRSFLQIGHYKVNHNLIYLPNLENEKDISSSKHNLIQTIRYTSLWKITKGFGR